MSATLCTCIHEFRLAAAAAAHSAVKLMGWLIASLRRRVVGDPQRKATLMTSCTNTVHHDGETVAASEHTGCVFLGSVHLTAPLVTLRDVRIISDATPRTDTPDPDRTPRCMAHGLTISQHNGADCARPSDRCSCATFASDGLHWDTCPGRDRSTWPRQ